MAVFAAGQGGFGASWLDRAGYFVPLISMVANDVPGPFKAYFSMAGHNGRQAINFVNLPLPTASLSGPTAVTLPNGETAVTVPADAATPYRLAVDDSIAQLSDDTTKWRFTSSVPADTLPTGSVDRTDGVLSFPVTFAGVGPRTLTVTSAGAPSVQATLQVMVSAHSGVQLAASAPSIAFGQSVELTAIVSGLGASQPQDVDFRLGADVIGSASLDAAHTARLTVGGLSPGAYLFSADYAGSPAEGILASTSNVVSIQVTRAQSEVQAALARPLYPQQPTATVRATVASLPPGAGQPTGTITVQRGNVSCTITLPAEECTVSVAPSGGSDDASPWTVTYSGDSHFEPSQITLQIVAVPTLNAWLLAGLSMLLALFAPVALWRSAR